jgi:hypothetical protein
LELLVKSKQDRTKKIVSKFLKKHYPNVVETKDYIFAEGAIPIALVAHMDTVFEDDIGVKELYYDRQKNVMFSPTGAGFDDKAGVFGIIQIVRSGLRPHVIFTTDEEIGGAGASELAKLPCPFEDLRYLIQLDRRGSDDCVFYNCDNAVFEDYIQDFGFTWNYGSFSDISTLCPAWGIAGVNLSIGYHDEHTRQEILMVSQFISTITKVKKMLNEKDIPSFEYIPSKYDGLKLFEKWYASTSNDIIKCDNCGKYFMEEEMFPALGLDGQTKFYCPDCLSTKVAWCERCGEAFEKATPDDPDTGLCKHCREVMGCSK